MTVEITLAVEFSGEDTDALVAKVLDACDNVAGVVNVEIVAFEVT